MEEDSRKDKDVIKEKISDDSSEASQKGFNPLIIVGILIVIGLAGFFTLRGESLGLFHPSFVIQTTAPSGAVKEFTVDGNNFAFNPDTITVNKGDTVKITFKDDDGSHNLVIEGYNVSTNTINTGDSASIQFVADKTGTFTYYCSVDSHREKGMVGKLIVQ